MTKRITTEHIANVIFGIIALLLVIDLWPQPQVEDVEPTDDMLVHISSVESGRLEQIVMSPKALAQLVGSSQKLSCAKKIV